MSKQDYSIFSRGAISTPCFVQNFAHTMICVTKTRILRYDEPLQNQSATKAIQSRLLTISMAASPTIPAVDESVATAPVATALAFAVPADATGLGLASRSSHATILARASSSPAKSLRAINRSNTIHASVLLRVSDSSCLSTTTVRPDSVIPSIPVKR
ncbi:hypothetical protein RVY52_007429 [Burkholderia cenocepacia]|nr:hypothetical protein [Burkholderia cenocepacia]ELK7726076.1 hypothetical protein [Burkholderia cenocepacia]